MQSMITFTPDEEQVLVQHGRAGLINKLEGRRAELSEKARRISGAAAGQERDLSASEATSLDEIFEEASSIEDKTAALADETTNLAELAVPPIPRKVAPAPIMYNGPMPPIMRSPGAPYQPRSDLAGSYARLFPTVSTVTNGFVHLGEFAIAAARGDPRVFQNAAGMGELDVGTGGAFLPPGFAAEIFDASLEQEVIRPRARVIPMATRTLALPRFDYADRSAGIAGLTPQEGVLDGATLNVQKAKTLPMTLEARKLAVLVTLSNELAADAPEVFASMLQEFMQRAMTWSLDSAFINGSVGPIGIINAPCTVVQTKEASQPSTTILAANVAKMLSRLAPESFNRCTWLVHPSAVQQLYRMVIPIQNVAGTENVGGSSPADWFQADSKGNMTLFGRPVVVTDKCQPLGTTGDIILADLTQYIIGLRAQAFLASPYPGFTTDELAFRLTIRVDGQPVLDRPITPRNGTTTLSHFIVLENR